VVESVRALHPHGRSGHGQGIRPIGIQVQRRAPLTEPVSRLVPDVPRAGQRDLGRVGLAVTAALEILALSLLRLREAPAGGGVAADGQETDERAARVLFRLQVDDGPIRARLGTGQAAGVGRAGVAPVSVDRFAALQRQLQVGGRASSAGGGDVGGPGEAARLGHDLVLGPAGVGRSLGSDELEGKRLEMVLRRVAEVIEPVAAALLLVHRELAVSRPQLQLRLARPAAHLQAGGVLGRVVGDLQLDGVVELDGARGRRETEGRLVQRLAVAVLVIVVAGRPAPVPGQGALVAAGRVGLQERPLVARAPEEVADALGHAGGAGSPVVGLRVEVRPVVVQAATQRIHGRTGRWARHAGTPSGGDLGRVHRAQDHQKEGQGPARGGEVGRRRRLEEQ
jgi:hypothetical protein